MVPSYLMVTMAQANTPAALVKMNQAPSAEMGRRRRRRRRYR